MSNRIFKARWLWWFLFVSFGVGAVAAIPSAAVVYKRWLRERQEAQKQAKLAKLLRGADDAPLQVEPEGDEREVAQADDALLHTMANVAQWGHRGADFNAQLLRITAAESQKWRALMPISQGASAEVRGQSWVNLGPDDARFQTNVRTYFEVDSGRINAIRVDPRDSNVVYIAASSGGIWKTYHFNAERPEWIPITDIVGNLSIGAIDLDPQNPDTLYAVVGDPFDIAAGGAVIKSTDGGGTWTITAEKLTGTYEALAGGRTEDAVSGRDLKVDPNNSNIVLIATEVGLFRSTDAGRSFSLAKLPNRTDGTVEVESSAWSIAYLGQSVGQSHWLVSGVVACEPGQHPPVRGLSFGQPPSARCIRGNKGDLWRSSDGGATWESLRAMGRLELGLLPPYPQQPELADVGRMALATADTTDPDQTIVYVQASSINDSSILPPEPPFTPDRITQNRNIAILKSTDGGRTFQVKATDASPLLNPTLRLSPFGLPDCGNADIGHNQSWYNLTLEVDPADANHVVVGGNLCGARTLDGGETWENISHWLPVMGGGDTETGRLPYVHADWHALTIVRDKSGVTVLAGTDGGIFKSLDVFRAMPSDIRWSFVNRGIVTHLFYSLGSGDPAEGNPYIAIGGLQDNGTRVRDLDTQTDGLHPTRFNQVLGGDGTGSIVTHSHVEARSIYFASFPGNRFYCLPDGLRDCNLRDEVGWFPVWPFFSRFAPNGDFEPFLIRYSAVNDDLAGALLTATTSNVFRLSKPLSCPAPCRIIFSRNQLTPWDGSRGAFPTGTLIRTVVVAPQIYHDAIGDYRLYGVVLSQGLFSVAIDRNTYQFDTIDMSDRILTWRNSPTPIGVGPLPRQRQMFATSMAFPADASHFGGNDGETFLATTTAPKMADELTLVPPEIGHLFLTTDRGATWSPFGNRGPSPLPNVPIDIIKFDPTDPSDEIIYVGTEIGVYRSTDKGASWSRFGVGLPMVRITDMFFAKNGSLMRVATYGRGLWEIYPNAEARGVKGTGDWDRNLQIDFLDLAALAARLGTTPATAEAPFYDWNLDVVGESSAIDEDDLEALLDKFGDHP